MALRAATSGDVLAILGLEQTCFAYRGERFNGRQVLGLLRCPRAVVRVAARRGQVLGWAAGLLRRHAGIAPHRRSGRVYALAVHPAARGRQVGGRLARCIIAQLARRGADRIYLEVRCDNAAAIALYRTLGFADRRKLPGYYGAGRSGLSMCLNVRTGKGVRMIFRHGAGARRGKRRGKSS